jgi:L-ribulose-5-phosphate 4-epimerase
MLAQLKAAVCRANRRLADEQLVTLTWGNVSGIDRKRGLVAIKPSGVAYDRLEPRHIVVVDLDGKVVQGDLRPSSDTPAHVRLYKAFEGIGGICHTHSLFATMFAQARLPIAVLGTTHADCFAGAVPVTRQLTAEEVRQDYEGGAGQVIIERFREAGMDPLATPAALVPGHAPFAWGPSAQEAVDNAVALEAVARMAMGTLQLRPDAVELEDYVLSKHRRRKHGPDAYYGQG